MTKLWLRSSGLAVVCGVLAAGAGKNGMQVQVLVENVFNSLGETGRFAALTPTTANQPYAVPIQPRTFWVKFRQRF